MNVLVQNAPLLLGAMWALVILFTLVRLDRLASCVLTVFGATVALSAIGYLGLFLSGGIPAWHRAVYLVSFPLACALVWSVRSRASGNQADSSPSAHHT